MAIISPSLPIIIWNVNGLNFSIKRYYYGFRKDSTICGQQQMDYSLKGTQRLTVKRWKKIFQVNGNQKIIKAGVAIILSDKIEFKSGKKKKMKVII